MSFNSFLSDEAPAKRSVGSPLVFGLVVVLLLGLGGAGYWFFRQSTANAAKAAREQKAADEMRDSIVLLLAQPRFAGREFEQQILGDANLEMFQLKKKDVYFSIPESAQTETALSQFLVDAGKIERAAIKNDRAYVGDYSFALTDENRLFFKTALANVKVNPDTVLKFKFERADYTMSLPELIGFATDKQIRGGKLNADTKLREDGKIVVFANHGAFVARAGEPSLQRLTNDLLRDLPTDAANLRELKIQRLLDFVSNEIEYDYTEAIAPYETLKRPDEVLMSRTADCSNKTILLASLLEQIGEKYILLYSPQHITVAVAQGNFAAANNLIVNWIGEKWMIAESTLPNFQIGETPVQNERKLKSVQYVQRAGVQNVIFDFDTGQLIEFR